MKIDRMRISLELLKIAVHDRAHRDVLDSLAGGIRAASKRASEAGTCGDSLWGDAVVDDECDLIENLLGAAFLVCQTQITAVTSRALAFRTAAEKTGRAFTGFGARKEDVRALARRLPAPAQVSSIEMLWALANYFKHREEWSRLDWSKLDGLSRSTASVVQEGGLRPSCTGNLRTGAEVLGNEKYEDLDMFADTVDEWAQSVLDACRANVGD